MNASRRIEAVALDAMGVLYELSDDVHDLLVPFVKARGCELSSRDITRLYTDCSLGYLSSRQLWKEMEIGGDTEDIETEYLSGHTTTPGLYGFLERMKQLGVELICVSNDVPEWSLKLRRRHHLEQYIATWIISGEVGSRKPSSHIYSCLRDALGDKLRRSLFIDDQPRNLAPAVKLGLKTILFSKGERVDQSNEWFVARSFPEIEEWVVKSHS